MTSKSIYFYGTCLIDLIYPHVGLAAIDILKAAGVSIIYPPKQSCCGQPAWNSGYREQAQEVIRAQLDLFPKSIPIIVPSASCAGMIRHHWPEAFEDEQDRLRATAVAERVIEFSDYLVNQLNIEPYALSQPLSVAVHNSCSSIREMKVAGCIEDLLQRMGATVVEQTNKLECCGFGGTFSVKQADISGAMVLDKSASLLETGADVVVSQDCGCLMNIGGALEHQQKSLPVLHIAEFLQRYRHE